MNANSIILQNIDSDTLKALISEVLTEKLESFRPKPEPKDKYITRKEVAAELRISLPTLNELTKKEKLKAYRIGGRVLYRESEVSAALQTITAAKYQRF
jgi:excisionase family DNA binding protein